MQYLSVVFFTEIEKLILKFMWNFKVPQMAKTMLKKNSPTLENSDFPTEKMTTRLVIKTVTHKDRQYRPME
jgi:hypothetical protein